MDFYISLPMEALVVNFGGDDVVLKIGAYVSGDTLTNDFTWYEKNPTVTFRAGLDQLPDSFTLKFVAGDKTVQEMTVSAEHYMSINIPRVVSSNMEIGDWKADCVDLVLDPFDFYITGQILDEDFDWYELNPTIVFTLADHE